MPAQIVLNSKDTYHAPTAIEQKGFHSDFETMGVRQHRENGLVSLSFEVTTWWGRRVSEELGFRLESHNKNDLWRSCQSHKLEYIACTRYDGDTSLFKVHCSWPGMDHCVCGWASEQAVDLCGGITVYANIWKLRHKNLTMLGRCSCEPAGGSIHSSSPLHLAPGLGCTWVIEPIWFKHECDNSDGTILQKRIKFLKKWKSKIFPLKKKKQNI